MTSNAYPAYFALAIKLLLIIMIGFVLVITREIMVPLSIAILFTFLLYPVSLRLEQLYVPRSLAIIISLLVAAIIIGAIVYFFWNQVVSFVHDLPLLRQKILEKGERITTMIEQRWGIPQERSVAWL